MKLYVIRHGQVDVNVKNQLNGRNESILTSIGIEQAQKASKEIIDKNIDLIICSPLRRTRQTCDLINKKQLSVVYDDRILERDTNSMMYKNKDNIDLYEFYSPNNKIVFFDCEGFGSILERVKKFIDDIKVKYFNKNVLIVTHNDICKAIHCVICDNYNVKEIIGYNQNNCELKEYTVI